MSRNLILSCAAVTLFGLLVQCQMPNCITRDECKALNMACNSVTHQCECQGATYLATVNNANLPECVEFEFSYQNTTTGLWTCPDGLQGSATWKSCCPPYMKPVGSSCGCMNNLVVQTDGTCGCFSNTVLVGATCMCPNIMYLNSNNICEPYQYSIYNSTTGVYSCPAGATPYGDPYYRCQCPDIMYINSNNICEPYQYSNYNSTTGVYSCPADAIAFGDPNYRCQCPDTDYMIVVFNVASCQPDNQDYTVQV